MDFWKALEELHDERRRLNNAIAVLEQMQHDSGLPGVPRRGRKTMPAEERRLVAERMRAYWARRKAGTGGASAAKG